MLDALRKVPFIVAIVLLVIVVLIEVGSVTYLATDIGEGGSQELQTPGFGIPYLALLDGLLLYTIALIAASLLIPERVHGRIQGIITFVVSLLVLIGAIVMIMIALGLLILMISLLLAVPFGTIVYFGTYADFSRGAAAVTLGLLMSLKIGFAVCLLLAHQRFLENKGLVLLVLTSLAANIIISFLHGLVPGFMVSITDNLAAIIIAILAAIWALFFLIGSIPSIIKVLRVDRALP